MFKLLFKYPSTVFSKGQLVFLAAWPVWTLGILVIAAAAFVAWLLWRKRGKTALPRTAALWSLETALLVLLLLLLWHPAISIATLKPQQNVVAVVVDDSRSMALREAGISRTESVQSILSNNLINDLRNKYQVRLYRLSAGLERIEKPADLTAAGAATHIGDGLKQLLSESAALPLGAVVLLSDGSENSAGIDAETMAEIRRRRIPVHTAGFGRERLERDVEISDVQIAPRALAGSRLSALVSFRQAGFAERKTKLSIRDGAKLLASREVLFQADGTQRTESLSFNAGNAGAKNLQVTLDPLDGEENPRNNSLNRVLQVDPSKLRILYIEGEPKWEFKFIRRALEEDESIQLVTMLRTTQNKIYRQGVASAKELDEGFPSSVEELFGFSGVILGGVEASYFTPLQQELLKQFVDRRGGGLLFLGGRAGLAEGGYAQSVLSDLLPVSLPDKKVTFYRDPATVELTSAGRDNSLCRLEEDPDKNVARWRSLPYLANFQEVGAPKPGAVVLAELNASGHAKSPLLATQNFGQGRTALLATSGTWRWQMAQPVSDMSHEMFWRQLLRWLVSGTRGRVSASVAQPVLYDDGRLTIRATVKDTAWLAAGDATVEARIMGPEGLSAVVGLQPDPLEPGAYLAEWDAAKAGAYLVEVVGRRGQEETGRDVLTFRRDDGAAENFRQEQNRELLERLAEQTGGSYYTPRSIERLTSEIAFSEAGLSVREMRDLWDMPVNFLVIFLLCGADWLLRRKWGLV